MDKKNRADNSVRPLLAVKLLILSLSQGFHNFDNLHGSHFHVSVDKNQFIRPKMFHKGLDKSMTLSGLIFIGASDLIGFVDNLKRIFGQNDQLIAILDPHAHSK